MLARPTSVNRNNNHIKDTLKHCAHVKPEGIMGVVAPICGSTSFELRNIVANDFLSRLGSHVCFLHRISSVFAVTVMLDAVWDIGCIHRQFLFTMVSSGTKPIWSYMTGIRQTTVSMPGHPDCAEFGGTVQ